MVSLAAIKTRIDAQSTTPFCGWPDPPAWARLPLWALICTRSCWPGRETQVAGEREKPRVMGALGWKRPGSEAGERGRRPVQWRGRRGCADLLGVRIAPLHRRHDGSTPTIKKNCHKGRLIPTTSVQNTTVNWVTDRVP